MLIRVYVTPNAKQARVVKVSEDYFEVWVDVFIAKPGTRFDFSISQHSRSEILSS